MTNEEEPRQAPEEDDSFLDNLLTGLKFTFTIAVIRGLWGFHKAVEQALRGPDTPPSSGQSLEEILKTPKEIERRLKE